MKDEVEVKQVSEREIGIGQSKYYLGEDDILYGTVVGEQDEKTILSVVKVTNKFKNMVKGKLKLFVDLTKSGKVSARGRKITKEALEDEELGKVALIGIHPVARVIAAFVMGVSKKKDVRFFKTKEEALTWQKDKE